MRVTGAGAHTRKKRSPSFAWKETQWAPSSAPMVTAIQKPMKVKSDAAPSEYLWILNHAPSERP